MGGINLNNTERWNGVLEEYNDFYIFGNGEVGKRLKKLIEELRA